MIFLSSSRLWASVSFPRPKQWLKLPGSETAGIRNRPYDPSRGTSRSLVARRNPSRDPATVTPQRRIGAPPGSSSRHRLVSAVGDPQQMSPATVRRPGSLPDQDSARDLVGSDPQDRAPGQERRSHQCAYPPPSVETALAILRPRRPLPPGSPSGAGIGSSPPHSSSSSSRLSRAIPPHPTSQPHASLRTPHHFVSATHDVRRSQGPIPLPRRMRLDQRNP